MKRQDVHRPSAIEPEDYEYVAPEYIKFEEIGDSLLMKEFRERIEAHMKMTGGTYSDHEHAGNCMCCGSPRAVYTTLFYHAKTNKYIRLGCICAEKLDMGDPQEFRALKKGVKEARQAKAGKQKAQAILKDEGIYQAWEIYQEGIHPNHPYEEQTVWDIVDKIVRYGHPSEKQTSFLRSLLDRINNREKIEAERQAEWEAAQDCPEGRTEITGEVLTTKVKDTPYGEQLKMLVKDDRGFKVWGSIPSSLCVINEPVRYDVEESELHRFSHQDVKQDDQGSYYFDSEIHRALQKGDRVRFTASLSPSKDDSKFGFYKRPTKAQFLTEEGSSV